MTVTGIQGCNVISSTGYLKSLEWQRGLPICEEMYCEIFFPCMSKLFFFFNCKSKPPRSNRCLHRICKIKRGKQKIASVLHARRGVGAGVEGAKTWLANVL